MRLRSQMIALGTLWIILLGFVYIGVYHFLFPDLLHLESQGGQEIVVSQYAYQQLFKHYLVLFVFAWLIVGGLSAYLLRSIFMKQEKTLQCLHHTMADEVKKEEGLSMEVNLLQKRAEKADKMDEVFHALSDHLNTIGTSLSLLKEKTQDLNKEKSGDFTEFLQKEFAVLDNHFKAMYQIIKSMQT